MYDKFEKFGLDSYPPEIRGRFNSFITTQFDDSLSVEMQIRSIIKWAKENFDETVNQTNHFIDFINDLIEYMNNFIETFDEKYQETILDKMQEWYNNGELETLINESLDTKYHEMDDRLATQLAHIDREKADKSEIGAPTQEQVDEWLNNNPSATTTVEDESIGLVKFDETNRFLIESQMMNVYEYKNINYLQGSFTNTVKNFSAVKNIKLYGFNADSKYRLRLIANNHPDFKYRFIISEKGSATNNVWIDVFDVGSEFIPSINVNGLTTIDRTIDGRRVIAKINYNQMTPNSSTNDGTLDDSTGRFFINQKNLVVGVTPDDENSKNLNNKQVAVLVDDNKSFVKFKYDETRNMAIEFSELGINKIIHPRGLYFENNPKMTDDFESLNLQTTIGTDWVSPYLNVVSSTGTTDFTGTVGGNHGTNDSGGFSTARNINHVTYVDGVKAVSGKHIGEKVTIVVENMVSASNKINATNGNKADSFKEIVTYTITKNNVEVSVEVVALEDLTFNGYVGLQMTTNLFDGDVYFNDSSQVFNPDGVKHSSPSLPFNDDRFVYFNANDLVAGYTNRYVGLGDLEYVGSSPIHYISQFDKIYSHLVNIPLQLEEGESFIYSGGYTFQKPYAVSGIKSAYKIKLNGQDIYCIDLKQSTNTFVNIPEILGKEIEVVEKTDSIEIDNFVSGQGVKILSTDFGTVKFKVKQ